MNTISVAEMKKSKDKFCGNRKFININYKIPQIIMEDEIWNDFSEDELNINWKDDEQIRIETFDEWIKATPEWIEINKENELLINNILNSLTSVIEDMKKLSVVFKKKSSWLNIYINNINKIRNAIKDIV